MKKFESLKDENLLECVGGRTVKLVAPIVIPLFCC